MKLSVSFIFTIIVRTCFAQIADNTHHHNEKNIYFQAFKQYLDFRSKDTFYSKTKKIDTLLVYKDLKLTDSLIDKTDETRIVLIEDAYSFIEQRGNKPVTIYKIFPLEFEKTEFSVLLVPFEVSIDKSQKKRLICGNPGSYKVVFKFEKDQFYFLRVEDHGI